MNIFKIGTAIKTLQHDAVAEEPRIIAFFEKAETALKPIGEAILAELLAKGTITAVQVAQAEALFKEALVLEKEFQPIVTAAIKAVE